MILEELHLLLNGLPTLRAAQQGHRAFGTASGERKNDVIAKNSPW